MDYDWQLGLTFEIGAVCRCGDGEFDGSKAPNGLSLDVEPGELRAVIGPQRRRQNYHDGRYNGKVKPTEGRSVFQGHGGFDPHDEADIANMGIGRKFRNRRCWNR